MTSLFRVIPRRRSVRIGLGGERNKKTTRRRGMTKKLPIPYFAALHFGNPSVTSEKTPFLVYRDQLLPASEGFIPRHYCGFTTLEPIYVGTKRRSDGIGQLPTPPIILGGNRLRGRITQMGFKQFGRKPPGFAQLAALHPALIHAQFGRGGALALPLARWLGVPLVITFHGGDATKAKHYQKIPNQPWGIKGIYLRRLPKMIESAKIIHCVSEFIRQTLIGRGFPPEKLVTLHLGIIVPPPELDFLDQLSSREPPHTKPYIFAAGRMVEKKGFSTLLDALALLPPGTDAVIAGDGELKSELHQQAQSLGLTHRVRWLGWQTPAQIRHWINFAACVAIPSVTSKNGDAEGLPSFLLEAMSQARPVIGTRHAGIPEAIRHGENGLLVDERDAKGLAAAIAQLLANPVYASELGRAAQMTVARDFNATIQSKKFEDLLLSCIND